MIKKLLNTKISKENKKGFTLAELLIVVAIIGVLVAISIPIFTSQLEKSREATDAANIRSAYAEVIADYLTSNSAASVTVTKKQTQSGWVNSDTEIAGIAVSEIDAGGSGSVTVSVDSQGNITIGSKQLTASEAASAGAGG